VPPVFWGTKKEDHEMQKNLQSRIDGLKTTALMEQRKQMGPVELVNWWTSFRQETLEVESFDDLST